MLLVPSRTPLLLGVCALSICAILLFGREPTAAVGVSRWMPDGAVLQGQAQPEQAAPLQPAGPALGTASSSVPLSLAGDGGFNVRSALDASGGALRNVAIAPGATWSFNAAVGNPAGVPIRTVGGVPGGGWCDLASRYVQAVRPLLPASAVSFVNHVTSSGIRLADVADADAVSIWNVDGQPGSHGQSQDLEMTNTLDSALHLRVSEQNGQVVVLASVGG
jgi:hypothetical protein